MNDSPKKPDQRRGWVRLIVFFILLALLIFFANRFWVKSDITYYFTLLEMTHRDDIDIAFVGSSVVAFNFDPETVTEKTGRVAFDASIGAAGIPSSVEIARQMFKTSSPELVVLVIDPQMLLFSGEDIQAQIRMLPFVKNPVERLAYSLDLAMEDGKYLDRLLLFRLQPITSFEDFRNNIELYTDPSGYAERHGLCREGPHTYRGQGHVHVNRSMDRGGLLEVMSIRPYIACEDSVLYSYTQRKLLEFKALCEKNGAKLLVMFGPDLTVYRLAVQGYVEKYEATAAFCAENGIDFCDFTLAHPEFLPCMDDYYYDVFHLNGKGSRVFSEKLSEYLNLYLAGEPVDQLFYANQQEALDHIDFITNTWINDETADGVITLTADCNCGPNVTPEYRFTLETADGSVTTLRDYGEDPVLSIQADTIPADSALRVYARPKDDPGQAPVRYTLYP